MGDDDIPRIKLTAESIAGNASRANLKVFPTRPLMG
jgi:hypothetical protein